MRAMRWEEMGGGLRRLDNTDGWGGRDRTSEWRNQNPLPYRLATPQQAEPERADDAPCPNRFGQRPVYRGCQAISTGWKAQFRPKSAPRQRDPLYLDRLRESPRPVSRPWRGPIPPIGVLRQPRFRGNTAAQFPSKRDYRHDLPRADLRHPARAQPWCRPASGREGRPLRRLRR